MGLRDFSGCDSLGFANTPRNTSWPGLKSRAASISAMDCATQAVPPMRSGRSSRRTGQRRPIAGARAEAAGREASSTAGVIDSQSVKTTASGGSRGYAAVKLIKGRKRHILTDTIGLPVVMIVPPANVQDRDGAPDLLATPRRRFPWLRHVFADGGYTGDKLNGALENHGDWTIEIVKRSDAAKGFVLLPRRWVVERTFAWLNRNRRLAKDVETTIESAVTWPYVASVKLMSRRLAVA